MAIYSVWTTFAVSAKVDVPVWTLVMGGGGIALGLATYGYKIMRVLGVKMTRLTNSRGAAVHTASVCACRHTLLGSLPCLLAASVTCLCEDAVFKVFAFWFAMWLPCPLGSCGSICSDFPRTHPHTHTLAALILSSHRLHRGDQLSRHCGHFLPPGLAHLDHTLPGGRGGRHR